MIFLKYHFAQAIFIYLSNFHSNKYKNGGRPEFLKYTLWCLAISPILTVWSHPPIFVRKDSIFSLIMQVTYKRLQVAKLQFEK